MIQYVSRIDTDNYAYKYLISMLETILIQKSNVLIIFPVSLTLIPPNDIVLENPGR